MNYINTGVSFLSRAARQAAEVLLPVAVSTAIEAGLQDQRVGKIVGGSCLILSGISVTIASGVPKRLKDRFITKKEIDPAEGARKTALRYGAATIGVVTTCYGAYTVAMGVLELMGSNVNSAQSTPIPKKSFIPVYWNEGDTSAQNMMVLEETSIPADCNQEYLNNTKEELLRCQEAKKLWNEVETDGSFTLCNATLDECPRACTILEKRQIFVHDTDDRSWALVVELNNLKRSEEFLSLNAQMCSMNMDQYAISTERVEYGSFVEAYYISHSCQKRGLWQGRYPIHNLTSFENYLFEQKLSRHTDLYREQWHMVCDPKEP